jgi:glutamine synthetase
MSFCDLHGLRTEEARAQAEEVAARVARDGIGVVRLAWADQHGVLRGKTVLASELPGALADGVAMTTTLLLKDTSHRTVFPVFTAGGGLGAKELEGAADCILLPDPATFRVLPWAPHSGWMLCGAHFSDGRPVPLSTRGLLDRVVRRAEAAGYEAVTGIEVEFHLFRLLDPKLSPPMPASRAQPPEVAAADPGLQLPDREPLRRDRAGAGDPAANLLALGLPLRSMEVEYGRARVEFTFAARRRGAARPRWSPVPQRGEAGAAAARLPRTLHVAAPHPRTVMSSGWHLHQSPATAPTGGPTSLWGRGELLSASAAATTSAGCWRMPARRRPSRRRR